MLGKHGCGGGTGTNNYVLERLNGEGRYRGSNSYHVDGFYTRGEWTMGWDFRLRRTAPGNSAIFLVEMLIY